MELLDTTKNRLMMVGKILGAAVFVAALFLIHQLPFAHQVYFGGPEKGLHFYLLANFCMFLAFLLFFIVRKRDKLDAVDRCIFFLILPLADVFMVESLYNANVFTYNFNILFINYSICLIVQVLLLAISNRINVAVPVTSGLALLLGAANYYVQLFRGSPLVPWDLLSIQTAMSVSGEYTMELTPTLILSLLTFALILWASVRFPYKKPTHKHPIAWNVGKRAALLGVTAVYFVAFMGTSWLSDWGVAYDPWDQVSAYRINGAICGFTNNTRYLMVESPVHYSKQSAQTIVSDLQMEGNSVEVSSVYAAEEKPNIIVIMNESFSDLQVVGDFETTEDYMPFTHSLMESTAENTKSGYTYVSVYGGATPNSEFEMLTGNTMGFLPVGSIPYQQYIKSEVPSLVSNLKALGYSATAIHPFHATGWSRDKVYPLLGFDQFINMSDWPDLEYLRVYAKDSSSFAKVIELYENKEEDEKVFLFNVTMQNHGGYALDYDATVHLEHMEGDYPQAEQYLSVIKESDAAFADLVSYFAAESEPTVILMFGDHQPRVEDAFYEELYGKSLSDLSLTELQQRYVTPFIIWANYDIPEETYDAVSLNYLSTMLMETAGLELPEYNLFLKELQKSVPAINANGYLGDDGIWYSWSDSSPYEEILNDYQILQYNNLCDEKNRVDSIYSIPITE